MLIVNSTFVALLLGFVNCLNISPGKVTVRNEVTNHNVSCDPQMRVSKESEYNLWYKVFQEKAEFITIDINVENIPFINGTPDHLLAIEPYNTWTWVNERGMHILQMDYRFLMWSLGTLVRSVEKIPFIMTVGNVSCYKTLRNEEKFNVTYQTFKKTLYKNNSCSSIVEDNSYLCHRCDCDRSHCIANRCYKFNKDHELNNTVFCDSANFILNPHMFIWMITWFILFNYSPVLLYWLLSKDDFDHSFGTHHGNNITSESTPEMCVCDTCSPKCRKTKYISLFNVCLNNEKYYPFISKIGYYLFRHKSKPLKIFRMTTIFLFLHMHIIWLFLANFVFYKDEFTQRIRLGPDTHMWAIEFMLGGVWNNQANLFLVCFIASLSGCISLSVVLWRFSSKWWFFSTTFFMLNASEHITPYVKERTGEYNFLSYNLLERRILSKNLKFWKYVGMALVPHCLKEKDEEEEHCYKELKEKDGDEEEKEPLLRNNPKEAVSNGYKLTTEAIKRQIGLAFSLVLIVPCLVFSFLILLLPLLDIVLQIPWNI